MVDREGKIGCAIQELAEVVLGRQISLYGSITGRGRITHQNQEEYYGGNECCQDTSATGLTDVGRLHLDLRQL